MTKKMVLRRPMVRGDDDIIIKLLYIGFSIDVIGQY